MEVVFFGSGPVAAECLKLLAETPNITIEAVITKPKPAHHRGSVPVLELAQDKQLTVHTPANKQELEDLFFGPHSKLASSSLNSRVGLVIDYGIIISRQVIDYFEQGIINSHFSLLPEWRGADPITFSILSGQPQTGVSLMLINERLDEGQLLAQDKIVVQPKETTDSLTQKLIQLSHQLITTHLPDYLAGNLQPFNQTGQPTYSRKLTKADGIVDWSQPAEALERQVRAFLGWPKSRAQIGKHQLILKDVDVIKATGKPGDFEVTPKKELIVFCGQGAIKIKSLQPPGKNQMSVEAFLAGYSL